MKQRLLCLLCALVLTLSACGTSDGTVPPSSAPAASASEAAALTWTEAVQAEIPAVTGDFSVTMLNVGKADCLVLQTQNHTVIVDSGLKNTADVVTDWLDENKISSVDALILTHFDKDHVGGAAQLLQHVAVEQVYQADYEGTNKRYEKYCEAAAELGVPVERVSRETSFVLDDVLFCLKPASPQLIQDSLANLNSKGEPDENDCSLVLAAWHGENSFAFLGDAEKPEINELLAENIGPFTFVKAPHHGRYESNSDALFRTLSPQLVFVTNSNTSDEDGDSAEPELLNILDHVGAEVCLSTAGTVRCISNGTTLTTEAA